jgi:hypothetical protein
MLWNAENRSRNATLIAITFLTIRRDSAADVVVVYVTCDDVPPRLISASIIHRDTARSFCIEWHFPSRPWSNAPTTHGYITVLHGTL